MPPATESDDDLLAMKRDCRRKGVTRIEDCTRVTRGWAAEHRGATVQSIAISGDRAAATFSNQGQELETVQLRRTATGEWLIDKLGPIGAVGFVAAHRAAP